MNTENFNKLFETHVPQIGSCDTVGGELLRAAAKIYYECYNNGFGNNVSGALNFLRNNGIDLRTDNVYSTLHEYCCGSILNNNNEKIVHSMVNLVVERVEEYISKIPAILTIPNNTDMHNLTDNNYEDEDEDEDEDDEY